MAFSCAPTDESFLTSAPKIYRDSFAIPLPAAAVWADLTSDSALHWCKALTTVRWTSPRPHGVGATKTVKVLGLISLDERYIAWDEGTRKAFVGDRSNLPLIKRIAEDYVVTPTGDSSCRFDWTIAVEPTAAGRPGGPLNGAIFGSLFKDTRRHYGA
ncbi:SRPBCC family protein [Conexibacter sp. W3-3-2]|uniref:MxaD family protein n=1 Tax=Paraconexibacter algicola TaxID=2133960 RepID=A0A2T4UF85_9ACTN|nr:MULTISPECIES: SRPBCC family protein [Solirubrobacterales]MTD47002.1 SRPBCC family protein [Conexibacter sp. W3-3-2]PTL56430.1 MxaD family protein [Paraconexibacter algicola]